MRYLALLMLLAVGAEAQSPVSTEPVRGVTVGIGTPSPMNPLERRVNLRLPNGTLQSFLNEISTQTRLEFVITGGLGECKLSAFLRELSARQALQLLLEGGGITYQSAGRSNVLAIARRHGGPDCHAITTGVPEEICKPGDTAISFNCKNASLSSLAELIYDQSEASIIVWNEATNFPISLKLKHARLDEAIARIAKNPALAVKQLRTENLFVFAVAKPGRLTEAEAPAGPTTYTPNYYKFRTGNRRQEPPANPAFDSNDKR